MCFRHSQLGSVYFGHASGKNYLCRKLFFFGYGAKKYFVFVLGDDARERRKDADSGDVHLDR